MGKKKKEKYNYYRFIVRTKKDLKKFEIDSIKNAIWNYLTDIAIIDIQASQMYHKPELRFEETVRS